MTGHACVVAVADPTVFPVLAEDAPSGFLSVLLLPYLEMIGRLSKTGVFAMTGLALALRRLNALFLVARKAVCRFERWGTVPDAVCLDILVTQPAPR
jgi:hypothetical protein